MQHPYSWICLPFHPLSSSWAPVEVLTGSCVRYTSCGLAFYAYPPTNQRSNLSAAAGPFPDRGGTDDDRLNQRPPRVWESGPGA